MNSPGSLRAVGKTSITLDIPTRAKLKELAGNSDPPVPVCQYVKGLAFGYIKPPSGGAQAPMPVISPGRQVDVSQQIAVLGSRAIEMSNVISMSNMRRMYVIRLANMNTKFNDLRHAQLLFDKLSGELEVEYAKAQAKDAGQMELQLEGAI